MARAVFMGSDAFSVPVVSALHDRGPKLAVPIHLMGVVTQPDRPAGRGRKVQPGPVTQLAQLWNVSLLQPERVREPAAIESILQLEPDVIVVASYGQILPRRLLESPPRFAINLHPSLLPLYRGSSPVLSALLNGDAKTGTTLMRMTSRMDAGPILDQKVTRIEPAETGGELTERLANLSAELLLRDLPSWVEGKLEERPQNEEEATYTARITRSDALLDWNLDAEGLARRVRAFNPRPGAFTYWEDRLVRVLRAVPTQGTGVPGQVVEVEGDTLLVGTGEGLLVIHELQLAGGRPQPAASALRGFPALRNAHFTAETWSSA